VPIAEVVEPMWAREKAARGDGLFLFMVHSVARSGDYFTCSISPGFHVLSNHASRGPVQPEDREPALARDCLHPVRLLTRRCFGAEVKVDRAVSVGDQLVTLVIPAGERLRSLQRGARLRVIKHHRAEILCRNILRDVEPVVLCAVERLAAESALKKLPKELYKSR